MQGEQGKDRAQTMERMARSRAKLRALLDPDEPASAGSSGGGSGAPGRFPRSRTMKLLTSRHGAGTAAALGAGLLLSRPAMALRLLRMIPLGAVARMLLLRLFTASGAKS